MKRISVLASAAVLAALALSSFPGCASYRLGSMLPPGIKTVYVPTFVNETSEPFIEVDATRATIQALQTDGSLKLVGSPDDADSILNVTIFSYELEPLTYDSQRRTAANEYRLLLSARVVLTDAKTGRVISENPLVQGQSTFDIAGDFTSSKASGLPAAVRDLGRRIVPAVVEAW